MKQNIIVAVVGIALAFTLTTCELSVNDPVRLIPIIKPYISVQPESYSYLVSEYEAPDALKVELFDWRKADGTISYQWYTFEKIEDYVENGGTAIAGATGDSYTPTGLEAEVGNVYYYYVVVTNNFIDDTNPDGSHGSEVASIQSSFATVSFYDSTVPFPKLTKQPVSAVYTIGRAGLVTALEVRVDLEALGTGTLSYQWYTYKDAAEFLETGEGTLLEGEDKAFYMPDVSTLSKGVTWFYAVVTNANSSRSRSITCLPVSITMEPGEKAETPRLLAQPKDQTVFAEADIKALKVSAEALDGGTLTYQWYSADKPAPTRVLQGTAYVIVPVTETEITGATDAEYTPGFATGSSYYFVRITNTLEDALDDTPAVVDSKVATVRSATAGSATANLTVTLPARDAVDPQNNAYLRQYIRGYGGMDVAWANFPETTAADTELQYNPDWGLGFNILRIMIVPPGSNAGNFTSHEDLITNPEPSSSSVSGGIIYNHRPDYLNNVKIVNKYNGYVLASPWTPPKEWKTNNSINSGGTLIPAYFKSYANYLRSFAQFMYYQGAPVYAISIANEPNYSGGYDGCEWTGNEMRDFWLDMGHFTDGVRGFGGGKSIPSVLTVNGESANSPNINFATLNNPVSRAAVDFYARHVYGSQRDTLWENNYADWKEGSPFQTECWMTEHNINSASPTAFVNDSTWNYIWRFMNDVDLVMRLNNENAFVWWASKRFYSFIGDGQSGTVDGNILPRGYGLSHYAKYSTDMTRIEVILSGKVFNSAGADATFTTGATVPGLAQAPINYGNTFNLDNPSAKVTAFVNADGSEYSVILMTPTDTSGNNGYRLGDVEIKFPEGFLVGSAQGVRSTGATVNGYMVPEEITIAADRKSAFVNVDRSQILSVKFTKQQ